MPHRRWGRTVKGTMTNPPCTLPIRGIDPSARMAGDEAQLPGYLRW